MMMMMMMMMSRTNPLRLSRIGRCCRLASSSIPATRRGSQQPAISAWSFPRPDPPPSDDEVASHGLPLLQKVVQHANANRPFLSEWPRSAFIYDNDDYNDDREDDLDDDEADDYRILSYRQVVAKAVQVAIYIQEQQQQQQSITVSPFIAHCNIPGSEYVACQWGAFASQKASVPLSISQTTPELEHVLQDCNPILIFLSARAPNHAQVLQAACNLNMADRVVHLTELLVNDDGSSSSSSSSSSTTQNDDRFEPAQLLEQTANSAFRSSLDHPALLLYTSSTTSTNGKPKGVLLTHRNLFHQITDLVAAEEWQPTDVALHLLPLHMAAAVHILSCASYSGAQVQFQPFHAYALWRQWANLNDDQRILPPSPPSSSSSSLPHAPGMWRQDHQHFDDDKSSFSSLAGSIGKGVRGDDSAAAGTSNMQPSNDNTPHHHHRLARPTVFIAVPTIYTALLEAARHSPPSIIHRAVEQTLHPMRLQISGSVDAAAAAAALSTTTIEEWRKLTHHTILEQYGMTELGMALSNPYNEIVAQRQPGHVGIPLSSIQDLRLVVQEEEETKVVWNNDSFRSLENNNSAAAAAAAATPIVGTLQVKGPTVFKEYWNRPEATKEAFTEDGYFDTGHMAEYNPLLDSYRILGRSTATAEAAAEASDIMDAK